MKECEEKVMTELDRLIYFAISQKDLKVPIDPLLSEYFLYNVVFQVSRVLGDSRFLHWVVDMKLNFFFLLSNLIFHLSRSLSREGVNSRFKVTEKLLTR